MTMSERLTDTPRDLEAHLVARAWKDEAFKAELLRDPKAVVEHELAQIQPGATLPEHVQIHVVEETPTTRYFVLPAKPVTEVGEVLSDADLEPIAGGLPITAIKTYVGGECYPCGVSR
jgi:hypothetical protein